MKQEYHWQTSKSFLPGQGGVLGDLLRRPAQEDELSQAPLPGALAVPIDLKEDGKEFVIYADLPGVDEDDIEIKLESNVLAIKADREFDHDNEDSEQYVMLERRHGPYKRVINIPGMLDKEGMTAKYKRGVLKIRIPKLAPDPRR
jgi:HSP20 family molecular chaperone IbpA